jgi:hypothetical protein
MGFHYYDECPDSVETQMLRLGPATALTRANIPCLVWAEDALCFVHFVPTVLFALQLLVPDDKLQAAAAVIMSAMPFERISTPPEAWLERKLLDPSRPSCFPTSLYLKSTIPCDVRDYDDPGEIYLHPQSIFHIDISDHTRSTTLASTLPPEFSAVRFPTRPAFFDALISTTFDPPGGRRVYNFHLNLQTYMSYLLLYTMRTGPLLPNGELAPQSAALRDSLRPENRQLFEKYCTRTQGRKGTTWYEDMLARREFMKAQGYGYFFSSYRVLTILSTPVNRPLPRDAQLLVARREAGVRTVQDLRALGRAAMGGDRSVSCFFPSNTDFTFPIPGLHQVPRPQ